MKKFQMYLSLAVISAVLPVVLWGVVSGKTPNLVSQAAQPGELRIWLEPSSNVVKVGDELKLTVMASFNDGEKLIPQIKATINSPAELQIDHIEISYKEAFYGETSLGDVIVKPTVAGKYSLSIKEDSVFTGLPNLPIVTFPANITVK